MIRQELLFNKKGCVLSVTWVKSVSKMMVRVRNLNRSRRKCNILKNKAYTEVGIKVIDGKYYVEFNLPTYTLIRD